ncbi:hypothetical protein PCANC_05409 [Puccinia coronata f. sp. avenae]|uniref:Uncharacterized protein n=1 Tax=Puccinia coronata f. sp. avenae TaxID=200324 RepID=A0A2N5T6W5_9BASI|nr:hypothetical protein PCANC_05409 [Puccinia coronata f. sp. avenae]PLW46302.1 hypothetical protein PCASD_03782 [Puccinia coronata f. sp. avenae]
MSPSYDFKLDSTNSIPSPGKGNSPQVYHAKPTLPDSTSDGQVTGSITGKTSLSSLTTPKFRGALSKTEGLKEVWSLKTHGAVDSAEPRILPNSPGLPTNKRILRESVPNEDDSGRRTICRWAPSRHAIEPPAKKTTNVYHPGMFEPVTEGSVRSFEIAEEEATKGLGRNLNNLEQILLQKLPWEPSATMVALNDRYTQIKSLLTSMLEGPLHEPKSTKLKQIRKKAFAHHKSQIHVLDSLKQVLELTMGFQDGLSKLQKTRQVTELVGSDRMLELIKHEAVIPVAKRIESELKDILTNVGDYVDLEMIGFHKETHSHPIIHPEESAEPTFSHDTIFSALKRALGIDHQKQELRRSIAQIPDDTHQFLGVLRSLQESHVNLQKQTNSKNADSAYDCFEEDLKHVRRHIRGEGFTPSWAVRILTQGSAVDKQNLDVVLQDALFSNLLSRFLNEILLKNEEIISSSPRKKSKNFHDLTPLVIKRLEYIQSEISRKQTEGLAKFFTSDLLDAMTTWDSSSKFDSEALDLVEFYLKSLTYDDGEKTNPTRTLAQNMMGSLEQLLGYSQVQFKHLDAIEQVQSRLKAIQHSLTQNQAFDKFLSTIFLHQIQKWMKEIDSIRFSSFESRFSSQLNLLGKLNENSLTTRSESQTEILIDQMKMFYKKLQKCYSTVFTSSHG